jgi:hypothetical protein
MNTQTQKKEIPKIAKRLLLRRQKTIQLKKHTPSKTK